MEIIDKTSQAVQIRFEAADIPRIADPIIKHAEEFSSRTLNLVYILNQQAYRMQNHFVQPPHAFD